MESRTYISLKRDVGSIFVVQWIAQLEDGKVKAINEVWSPHKPCGKDESELLNDYAYRKHFNRYLDRLESIVHQIDDERADQIEVCIKQTDETNEKDEERPSNAKHIY